MFALLIAAQLAATPTPTPGAPATGSQTCDRAAEASVLTDLKTRLWPALYAQGDTTGLDRLLAAEFQMIEGDGAVSKRSDELAYVARKKPDPPGRRFVYRIDRLDVFENCTAIISGQGRIVEPPSSPGGPPKISLYSSSNVLIKRAGVWQAIASHVSGQKEEAAKPEPR